MNDTNRKKIRDIVNKLYGINSIIDEFDFSILEDIIDKLRYVKEDEEEKFYNLSESLQQTEKAIKMQSAGEYLEESIENVQDFDCESFKSNIESLINSLEEIDKL